MGKKNKNKQAQQEDAEDAGAMQVPEEVKDKVDEDDFAAKETADDGGYDEDIRTTMDNIDLPKKNTRKKKNKGGAQLVDDDDDEEREAQALAAKKAEADMLAAFADSDDDGQERKGKNNKKKDRREKGGKKGKKGQQDEEEDKVAEEDKQEEEIKESEKPVVPADDDFDFPEEEKEEVSYPLNVFYCPKCGVPFEYCSFVVKNLDECKATLLEKSPVLYRKLYGEPDQAGEDGEEKKEGADAPKEKKKVKFNKSEGEVHVYKLKRGKKTNCLISGMEYYAKDLKSLAQKFGKKFACGSSLAKDDLYGDVISVQGDIEYDLMDFMEEDKELIAMNIPIDKIIFEDKGNKKGRKRA